MCLALFVVVLASRWPFLDAGFGWDEDAWGNVVAASHLAQTGEFNIPRPPGFPLLQWIQSWLWRGGPLWINGATAVMSAFAAVGLSLFARRLGFSVFPSLTAGLALAFTPIVYLNSVNAMDYVWALAFGLWGLHSASARRPALAGLLLGCAIGCRITLALFILPIAGLVFRDSGLVRILRMLVTALVVAIACYVPILHRMGLSFLTFSDQPFHAFAPYFLHTITVGLWGILGFLSLILACVLAVAGGARWADSGVPERERHFLSRLCIGTIVLYVLLFLRLPVEAAYLIPVVPFVLLWLMQRLHPVLFLGLALDFVLSSYLLWIPIDHEGVAPAPAVAEILSRPAAWRARWALHWGSFSWRGPVPYTHALRRQQIQARDAAMLTMASLPTCPLRVNSGAYTDYFFADYASIGKLLPCKVTFTNDSAGAPVDYTVRGFHNRPALGFGAFHTSTGNPTLKITRFDEPSAQITALDFALVNTVLHLPDQPAVPDVLMKSEFYVPFVRAPASCPFLIQYNGHVGLPIYDRVGWVDLLRPWEPWIEFKKYPGDQLLSGVIPTELLLVNPGQPTEFVWPVTPEIFQ